MSAPLFDDCGATFSSDRRYRYHLWRRWDARSRCALFVMLNPSTADEAANDPTVERCERRARAMGNGGVEVVNLFAFRATDPREMKAAHEPVGPDNDRAILDAASAAAIVVCAWGQHGTHLARAARVVAMLRDAGVDLHALKITSGEPHHPLYVPYTSQPFRWLDTKGSRR